MRPTKEQALEWGKEAKVICEPADGVYMSPWPEEADISAQVEALVQRAFAEGQKASRRM